MKRAIIFVFLLLPVFSFAGEERVCGVFFDKKKLMTIDEIREKFAEKNCEKSDILFIRSMKSNAIGIASHLCVLESMVPTVAGVVCEYRGAFREGDFEKGYKAPLYMR